MHSSYSELRLFVGSIRPKSVYACVIDTKEIFNNIEISLAFRGLLKGDEEGQQKHAFVLQRSHSTSAALLRTRSAAQRMMEEFLDSSNSPSKSPSCQSGASSISTQPLPLPSEGKEEHFSQTSSLDSTSTILGTTSLPQPPISPVHIEVLPVNLFATQSSPTGEASRTSDLDTEIDSPPRKINFETDGNDSKSAAKAANSEGSEKPSWTPLSPSLVESDPNFSFSPRKATHFEIEELDLEDIPSWDDSDSDLDREKLPLSDAEDNEECDIDIGDNWGPLSPSLDTETNEHILVCSSLSPELGLKSFPFPDMSLIPSTLSTLIEVNVEEHFSGRNKENRQTHITRSDSVELSAKMSTLKRTNSEQSSESDKILTISKARVLSSAADVSNANFEGKVPTIVLKVNNEEVIDLTESPVKGRYSSSMVLN
jgi:hypothetical protein